MENKIKKAGLTLGAIIVTLAISAQDHHPHHPHKKPNPEKLMERLDTDKNGSISKAELAAADKKREKKKGEKPKKSLSDRFEKADTDNNGEISLAELKADMKKNKPSGANFVKRFDQNSDNKLDKTEAKVAKEKHAERLDARTKKMSERSISARFSKIDTNGDGQLSLTEIEKDVAAKPAPKNPDREKPSAEKVLKRIDTDKNGSISKTEAETHDNEKKAKAEERKKHNVYDEFEAIDTNKDGFLTATELDTFHKAKMQERKGKKHNR